MVADHQHRRRSRHAERRLRFFFWLEKSTEWRLFQFLPPLIFIYLVPMILSNTGILTGKSPVYDTMQGLLLPAMLVLLLLNVNVGGSRVMGRGIGVMLFGTLGVMLGARLGLVVVKPCSMRRMEGLWKPVRKLDRRKRNLAAVKGMVNASGAEGGLAVLADSTIYSFWLPILLISKRYADRFALHRRRVRSGRENAGSRSSGTSRAAGTGDARLSFSIWRGIHGDMGG